MGVTYLIHFERAHYHAQHYLGHTEDLEERLARHRAGNGARLLQVIQEHGIPWRVVRVWPDTDYGFEQWVKSWHSSRSFCPICNPKMAHHLYEEEVDHATTQTDLR